MHKAHTWNIHMFSGEKTAIFGLERDSIHTDINAQRTVCADGAKLSVAAKREIVLLLKPSLGEMSLCTVALRHTKKI